MDKDQFVSLIVEALDTPEVRSAIHRLIGDEIYAMSRSTTPFVHLIESTKSAQFILDNIPLDLGKPHGTLKNDAIARADPNGLHIELGCWQGASINAMAQYFPERRFYGFDSFEGLPEAWSLLPQGSFNLNGEVPQGLPNVTFIKGWFDDTLPTFLREHAEPISFLHIDCDLYVSTMSALRIFRNRLRPGTEVVLDDYMLEPGWAKAEHKAFHDFCSDSGIEYRYTGYAIDSPTTAASVVLTKVPADHGEDAGGAQ